MRNLIGLIKKSIKSNIWRIKFIGHVLAIGSQPKLYYLMGLGDRFPNLGDQAQAAAIPIWLKKHFKLPIVEVKNFEIEACLAALKKLIQPQDIVFLHSGGNFGDDWPNTQLDRESIIAALPNNKIVQLPQTIYYSESKSGSQIKEVSQMVINAHPSILLFGRDFQSAEIAKKLFSQAQVSMRPDMVLSLQETVEKQLNQHISRRPEQIKKVLLVLRNDKEGIYDEEIKQSFKGLLMEAGYDAHLWDTDVDDVFPDQAKFNTLAKYLKFMSEFDAVITDRYHGLIFSVLVTRPCLVLKTHNHKLTSAFDWFEAVNYVKRVDSTDEIISALQQLQALTIYTSPRWNDLHFDPMAKEVKQFLN
jgi:pyruvyl transferase EpsI